MSSGLKVIEVLLKRPQKVGVLHRPLGGRGGLLLLLFILDLLLRSEAAEEVGRGRPQAPEEVRGGPPGGAEAPEKVRGRPAGGAAETSQKVGGALRGRPETPEEVGGAAAAAARRPERPQEVAVVHPVVPQIGRRGESAASLLVGDDALRLAEVFVTVFRAIEGPERPEEVGGASSRRAKAPEEMG